MFNLINELRILKECYKITNKRKHLNKQYYLGIHCHTFNDINRINKVAWTIGIMVFTNLAFLLRDTFF